MVVAGTNFYGRVKRVGNTEVRTMFMHFFFFPLDPMHSAYYVPGVEVDNGSIPFLSEESSILSFRMARRDWLSVLLAYFQGLAVVLAFIFGTAAYLMTWELYDPSSMQSLIIVWGLLLGSIGLFFLSFFLGQKDHPERTKMRLLSQSIIGYAIDPKYLDAQGKAYLLAEYSLPGVVPDSVGEGMRLFLDRLGQSPSERTPYEFISRLEQFEI